MPRDYSILHSLHGAIPESAIATFQLVLSHLYDLNDIVQKLPKTQQQISISDIESQIQLRKKINLSQFLGILAQPQNAAIPEVSVLPDANDPLSQDGGAVRLNGVLYVFDGDPEPGVWVAVTAAGVVRGTVAAMATYAAASYPNILFYQTDRTVFYLSDGTNWLFAFGTMFDTFANRPATLGANDARFRFVATDTEQHFRWTGAAWVDEVQTSAALLRIAGVTSSFPAIKRSGAILQARLADDSAYTDLEVLDEVYGGGWDTSIEVPTKNAVYDKIESLLSTALTSTVSSPANPAGTTSTTGLMMGLAGAITPVRSGKVMITITGMISCSILLSGASVQLRYGTGTAPTNGAALTGTTLGVYKNAVASVAGALDAFSLCFIVSGLALSTAIWIDVGLKAVTSGTATVADLDIVAVEL